MGRTHTEHLVGFLTPVYPHLTEGAVPSYPTPRRLTYQSIKKSLVKTTVCLNLRTFARESTWYLLSQHTTALLPYFRSLLNCSIPSPLLCPQT